MVVFDANGTRIVSALSILTFHSYRFYGLFLLSACFCYRKEESDEKINHHDADERSVRPWKKVKTLNR